MNFFTKVLKDKNKKEDPVWNVQLRSGRLTLFWSLVLDLEEPPECSSVIDLTVEHFAQEISAAWEKSDKEKQRSLWQPVDDPMEHIPRPTLSEEDLKKSEKDLKNWKRETYAEVVYFHDFVQDFLYRRQKTTSETQPPFYLFCRNDVRRAEVSWSYWDNNNNTSCNCQKTVTVDRLNLYLFRTGVAIFVMDMAMLETPKAGASCGWTLAEFLDFQDYVRRVYIPFFKKEDKPCSGVNGGLVVNSLSWQNKNGEVLCNDETLCNNETCSAMNFTPIKEACQIDRVLDDTDGMDSRQVPVFAHWRALLPQMMPLASYAPRKELSFPGSGTERLTVKARWKQILDERMATLATLDVRDGKDGVSRYRAIRPGDFIRLCFADYRGEASSPYDDDFMQNFEKDHCYDRFHSSGTRYMGSGYGFTMISGNSFAEYSLFHMRRHYYQMMLVAQLEIATMLFFSSLISLSVKRFGNECLPQDDSMSDKEKRQRTFENAMLSIQEEFLQFVHRFRFTGVTNQIQGRELFELMRRHLHSDELFQDLNSELTNANSFLQARHERRATEAGEAFSKTAEWFSVFGAIGLLLTMIFSALGMNLIFDSQLWMWNTTESNTVPKFLSVLPLHGLGVGIVIGTVGLICHRVLLHLMNRGEEEVEDKLKLIKNSSLLLVKFGILLFSLSLFALLVLFIRQNCL